MPLERGQGWIYTPRECRGLRAIGRFRIDEDRVARRRDDWWHDARGERVGNIGKEPKGKSGRGRRSEDEMLLHLNFLLERT